MLGKLKNLAFWLQTCLLNLLILVVSLSLNGCLSEKTCNHDPNGTGVLKQIKIPDRRPQKTESDDDDNEDEIDGYVGGDIAPDLDLNNEDSSFDVGEVAQSPDINNIIDAEYPSADDGSDKDDWTIT